MAKKPVTSNLMSSDGLRYAQKTSGTSFKAGMNTMSCFKCGTHRPRSELVCKKIIGTNQFVCPEPCKR